MIKMKGLGRGLDALLSGSDKPHGDEQRSLPIERLRPGKYQPRTQMDEASLAELAASIKSQGVMQPILARAIENTPGAERYEIVAGERRWRAAQLAGLAEVPVLIRNIPDEQALAMALIENIQRENLNPLEEAQGLQRLIDEFGGGPGIAAGRQARHGPCPCPVAGFNRPAGRPGAACGAERLVRTRNRAVGSPVAQSTEKCAGKSD